MKRKLLLVLHSLNLVCLTASAAPLGAALDWPQYRGPNHDGISPESIRSNWTVESPRVVWRIPMEPAYSSMTVSQGRVLTQVRRDLEGEPWEVCVALDAATGRELWATPLALADADGGVGPQSTPVADGDRVYVYTSYLALACLEAGDGRLVWRRDFVKELDAPKISYRSAASPLIEGDLVLVNSNAGSGGCLLAVRKNDGGEVWRTQRENLTHSTPVAATLQGVRQVIFLAQSGLVSVNPQNGALLWKHPFRYDTCAAPSPVVADDVVICTAAYSAGSQAVRPIRSGDQFVAQEQWRNSRGNEWSTPIVHQGFLYGIYGSCPSGVLGCVDTATGLESRNWGGAKVRTGGILLVGEHLVVLTEAGELLLAAADSKAYVEFARFQALDTGKCWNVPAVSNGRIYARSTTQAVCLDVAANPPLLRIQGLTKESNGTVRFEIRSADGAALRPDRLVGAEVLATTDLGVSLRDWSCLNPGPVFTNGVFQVDDPESTNLARRFYLIREAQ